MLAAHYYRKSSEEPFRLDGNPDDDNRGISDWKIQGVEHLHPAELGMAELGHESLVVPLWLMDELPETLGEELAQRLIRWSQARAWERATTGPEEIAAGSSAGSASATHEARASWEAQELIGGHA